MLYLLVERIEEITGNKRSSEYSRHPILVHITNFGRALAIKDDEKDKGHRLNHGGMPTFEFARR